MDKKNHTQSMPFQKEKTAPSQSPNELKDEMDRLKKDNEKLKKDLKERKNVSDIHPLKSFAIDYSGNWEVEYGKHTKFKI